MTKDGFKFTTKDQTSELAKKIEDLQNDQKSTSEETKKIMGLLTSANDQIAQLKVSLREIKPDTNLSNLTDKPLFDPKIIKDLTLGSEIKIERSKDALQQLKNLQQELQAPKTAF